MSKLFLFLTIAVVAFSSCGHTKKNAETIIAARNYYDSVNYQYNLNQELQQKIFDKATEIILVIKERSVTIDTKELKLMIYAAKVNNNTAINNIEKITEIDKNISYKQIVIDYLKLFNSFYDFELHNLIKLVDEKDENAYFKYSNFVLPKLKMIKDKEFDFVNAQEVFKSKYPIGPDGNIKAGLDFELVILSDFEYEQANLKDGEEIYLLSYSGSKNCNTEIKYYEQFIGIAKSTGDTVRILVPCSFYDSKNVRRIAYYRKEVSDSIQNVFLGKSFIIFNKHLHNLEKKDFKTSVGMLEFSKE